MLLCYDDQNGIIDEEEDIMFAIKLGLCSISTTGLPYTFQFVKTI
jgi:hypothetical protein